MNREKLQAQIDATVPKAPTPKLPQYHLPVMPRCEGSSAWVAAQRAYDNRKGTENT